MKRMLAAFLALPLLVAAPSPAAPEGGEARYEMRQTEDGFLRLDRHSGQVSHCRAKAGSYVCESVADDREAYEERIAELERDLARAEAQMSGELPSEDEIAGAFAAFESFAKYFSRAVRVFKGEMDKIDEPLTRAPEGGNGT